MHYTTCLGKCSPVLGKPLKNSSLAAWTLAASAGFMTFEIRDCHGKVPSLQWTRQRARFSRSLLRAVHPRCASLNNVHTVRRVVDRRWCTCSNTRWCHRVLSWGLVSLPYVHSPLPSKFCENPQALNIFKTRSTFMYLTARPKSTR